MPQQLDIRWKQRLNNYSQALAQLEKAILLSEQRSLTDLEKLGLIQHSNRVGTVFFSPSSSKRA